MFIFVYTLINLQHTTFRIMKLTSYIIIGLSATLFACTAKKATTASKAAAPAASDIVAEIDSKYTDIQKEEGKTIWQANCQKCHKLYEPESHTIAKWENILQRMSKKAKLNDVDAGKVRAYVLTHAKS